MQIELYERLPIGHPVREQYEAYKRKIEGKEKLAQEAESIRMTTEELIQHNHQVCVGWLELIQGALMKHGIDVDEHRRDCEEDDFVDFDWGQVKTTKADVI